MLKLPRGPFEGYIFDCDGTLALSMPIHFRAWQHALKKHEACFEFTWDIFHSLAGLGLHYTVEVLNERFDDILDPDAVLWDQEKFVEEHIHQVKPNEEVVALARKLAAKHPVSVATGNNRKGVHAILEAIGAADIFEIVISQDDVENSKPAPDIFLLAAERMGCAPKRCLVFEDSPSGIQAAQNAGMKYVWVKPQLHGLHEKKKEEEEEEEEGGL
tara:strand:+ start:19331 stop:19975 length:645 start_codon:yes stop_codon:yes gene_type:complete